MRTLRLACLIACVVVIAASAWAETAVSRQAFARSVVDREPVETASSFPKDVGKVVYFTEITGAGDGTEIKHVWKFKGEVVREQALPVRGVRFRTWSEKSIDPSRTGEWTAEVLDDQGKVLATGGFTISE